MLSSPIKMCMYLKWGIVTSGVSWTSEPSLGCETPGLLTGCQSWENPNKVVLHCHSGKKKKKVLIIKFNFIPSSNSEVFECSLCFRHRDVVIIFLSMEFKISLERKAKLTGHIFFLITASCSIVVLMTTNTDLRQRIATGSFCNRAFKQGLYGSDPGDPSPKWWEGVTHAGIWNKSVWQRGVAVRRPADGLWS